MPVALSACERHRLKKMAYGHKTPHKTRQRATIVLLAARGRSNARIASQTRMRVDTARTWRGRLAVCGLADRRRSGRPPSFTPLQVRAAEAAQAVAVPAGMTNGPEDEITDRPSIDWREVEDDVRRLRQRVFTASQEESSAALAA